MQNLVSGPFTSSLFAVAVVIPLGVNVAVFAVAGVLAFLLPASAAGAHRSGPAETPAVHWFRQLVGGYRFIMASPMLRTLWFLSTFVGLCLSAALAAWVLFVLDRLGVPEAWFGVFMLSGAVGGILGTLVMGRAKNRLGAGLVMALANLVGNAVLIVVGALPTIWVASAMVRPGLVVVVIPHPHPWSALQVKVVRQGLVLRPPRRGRYQGPESPDSGPETTPS